ncbi:C-C chemokine receptor type 3 [Merluccius polli]|uniref:C-C chemokine receptor type 3 n=1 Tax=Merluccius polli TaxID=89951 RepID=A0AA47MYR5_MERPO|nr:C-C chemokine receptor type 3 [Merluccius polli]
MNTTTPFYDLYSLDTIDYNPGPVPVCERKDDNYLGAQLSVFYFIMFVLSLVGNGLVLVIIYRFEKLTTVTNIFLLNLVVSDLIFMCSLPFWGIYQQLSTWIFSTSMCKIVGSAYFLGFYSSILFLTLLTFDQHLAVVYSLVASRLRRQNYAIACCTGVWLLSCLACIKPIILYNVFTDFNNKQFCEEYPSNIVVNTFINVSVLKAFWTYLQLFFFFLFPLAVIVYCYIRVTITVVSSRISAKFRTVRMIFAIVLLFFVCWTPYNVVLLMHYSIGRSTSCERMQRLGYALQVTRNIAYLYFCISPILYSFVGKRFQNHLRQLLVKSLPCLK